MIQTLSSDAFAGQLPAPTSTGVSPIFRGKIKLGEESLRCYIKPLPDHYELPGGHLRENREILNEALGYTVAKHAGHPVAEHAGIIMLNLEQIPDRTRQHLQKITPRSQPQSDYLAWFSQDMQQPSLLKRIDVSAPEPLRNRQLRHLAAKLAKHPDTPGIVTLDEWTENSDRNLGNLLERPDGMLSLIDHGWLFRSPLWSPDALYANPAALRNVVRELIDENVGAWSEKAPIKSARLMAYNNLVSAWRARGAEAARTVLEEFLDAAESNLVMSFLSDRLDPPTYKKAVGLLV